MRCPAPVRNYRVQVRNASVARIPVPAQQAKLGRFTNAECLGNRAGNKCRVTDRCQRYEGYAIDKTRSDVLDKLKRKARLADTGRSGQSEQARTRVAQQLKCVGTFSLSTNQPSRRHRKIERGRV